MLTYNFNYHDELYLILNLPGFASTLQVLCNCRLFCTWQLGIAVVCTFFFL